MVLPLNKREYLLIPNTVQSQMTDVPDNQSPIWPNFKQTEEVYNITMYF